MTALRIPLGARVKVAQVFQLPPPDEWPIDGEYVDLSPVPNPLADTPAVVVGASRRRTRFEVTTSQIAPDDDKTWLSALPGYHRTFYVIRYTLTGRRRYTLAEFMVVLP